MATDTNTVVLCGRLVASMGLLRTQSGYPIGSFTIAVNRGKKNKNDQWEDKASYIDCSIFGNTAQNLSPYLVKGKQVCVQGYLEQDSWEKEGQKFSRIRVVVTNLQLIGGSSAGKTNPDPKSIDNPSDKNMSFSTEDDSENIIF